MKDSDARDIIAMTRGATTQWPVDDDTVIFWMHSLRTLDAEAATKAVMLGAKSWDGFPPWSSFYEAYRAVQRAAEAATRDVRAITDGRRGYATPEWVWVWQWCRNWREPQDWRVFPQQEEFPEFSISMADYEVLRDEWKAADSPKGKAPSLVRTI